MPSPISPPSQSSRLRAVTLLAIFFFSALQVKNLKALFGSGIGEEDLEAAWSPYYSDVPRGQFNPKEARKEQRIRQRKENAEKKNAGKKKKKINKPRRFEASNYEQHAPLPWTLPKPKPVRYQKSHEFMRDYVAVKRKHNIPLPWEQQQLYADKLVTLPLPIISLNFPKSATLTMKEFFSCGGLTSIHTSTIDGRIAVCMMENHFADKPPMDGCNTHKLRPNDRRVQRSKGVLQETKLVPIDFISDIGLQGPPCYYASLHDGGLENIAKHYPNSTILLVTRDASQWARSVGKWGSMVHRFRTVCGFNGDLKMHPNGTHMEYWDDLYRSSEKEEYWAHFYRAHTQKIRDFAMQHLSLTYVEVELEHERMGETLEEYTKVSKSCVLHCHPGPKWVVQNNATHRCHPVGENPADKRATAEVQDAEESDEEEENNEEDDTVSNGDDAGDVDEDVDEDIDEENEEIGDVGGVEEEEERRR